MPKILTTIYLHWSYNLTGNEMSQDNVCEMVQDNSSELVQDNMHRMVQDNSSGLLQETFCKLCQILFPSPVAWKDHMTAQHPGFYTKICDICFRGFKSNRSYKLHFKMYHSKGKCDFPECPVCGKKFSCASSLACHIKVHEEGKEFECRQCGRTYKYKNNLKAHKCSQTLTRTFTDVERPTNAKF